MNYGIAAKPKWPTVKPLVGAGGFNVQGGAGGSASLAGQQRQLQQPAQQNADNTLFAPFVNDPDSFGGGGTNLPAPYPGMFGETYDTKTPSPSYGMPVSYSPPAAPPPTIGRMAGPEGAPVTPTAASTFNPSFNFRPSNYMGYPTQHDQGMNMGAGLNNWLIQGYLNGPQSMTQQLNDAWSEQTARNQQAALYQDYLGAHYGTQNRLIDALMGLNGGGGGGGGGGGFRQFDIAGNPTGLYADAGGNTGTNVTASALPEGTSEAAAALMRAAPQQSVPGSIAGVSTGGAQNALADAMRSSDMQTGGRNAMAFDRAFTPANSDLGYEVQGERANQGVQLANWLLRLQGLNNNGNLFQQNLLTSLIG